jgi:hypothetical protein
MYGFYHYKNSRGCAAFQKDEVRKDQLVPTSERFTSSNQSNTIFLFSIFLPPPK